MNQEVFCQDSVLTIHVMTRNRVDLEAERKIYKLGLIFVGHENETDISTVESVP